MDIKKRIELAKSEIERFKKGCGNYTTVEGICDKTRLCKKCRSGIRRHQIFLDCYEYGKKEGKR